MVQDSPNNNFDSNQPPSNGKAIASLVLGIIAIICVFFGYGALLGVVVGVVGLILGMQAKKANPSGMATAGIVLSIVAIAVCVVGFIACVACIGTLAGSGALDTIQNEVQNELNNYNY